ncbi:MAG TPA: PDDEXK nuclease domain-containing protein [Chitinophaga sp.]|uniref:PDDEXK nuclease domain-containing protein n=1 Tax=Chitinophaga sp. TaxID=1869181 RepID=UPI002BC17AE8|nr:PDDEXK nuclease domain-containing protein [Chitinophaga sp.]HVI46357.1 PDDEXK nuclease domain-containing protein [Chitinophaga sp.]
MTNKDYREWLVEIKNKVKQAQLKAVSNFNTVLIELYWELGKEIISKQTEYKWGENFLEQLSIDLKKSFPQINGFSRRNLYTIRQWYVFFSHQFEFVPQPVAQLPWSYQRLLISKIKDLETVVLYAKATHKNGWSRNQLEINIKHNYHLRQGKADHNFDSTLPKPQSDLAAETIKDPYHFDFLGLEENAQEREIELALTQKITHFMLELGKGFAFVGRQYKLEISDSDYFLDLLFYHLHLRCFVVIELKAGKFLPEYAGKLNFYLSAVDSKLKHITDSPSIGIILCRLKDKIEVEYALRDLNKPIGISSFELSEIIPDDLKTQLPTIEEMERELLDE